MSQLGLILQESLRTDQSRPRTILGLLAEQIDGDGVNGGPRRRRSFKQRLGFIGMGCCGATWGFRPATVTVSHGEDGGGGGEGGGGPHQLQFHEMIPGQASNAPGPECVAPTQAGSGMNLAAALAAERQFRESQEPDAGGQGSTGDGLGGGGGGGVRRRATVPGTPWRVSLLRLLEETEGGDAEAVEEGEAQKGGGLGTDTVCCVCMGRKKGAAFIPCGHTFCRVCSRELWLNRGSCPLCNRPILEILDIF